uniref:LITAF domain-containing protein n=1 Tax=Macrostomum lignano TaxID=282301 RepID=A0A1I8FEC5_9PLAT
TYTAGCGGRIKASYSGANGPVDEYISQLPRQGSLQPESCGSGCMQTYRFCLHAKVSRVEPPSPTAASYEKSASRLPFFNAGCGPCPAYNLSTAPSATPTGSCNATSGGSIPATMAPCGLCMAPLRGSVPAFRHHRQLAALAAFCARLFRLCAVYMPDDWKFGAAVPPCLRAWGVCVTAGLCTALRRH